MFALLLLAIFICSNAFIMPATREMGRNRRLMSVPSDLLGKVSANLEKGSIVVIKYGGHAMEDENLAHHFCEDVVELKRMGMCPVVVHGGGPQIKAMLTQMKVESNFVNGLRVTDSETMNVVQMVLSGRVNKNIVGTISSQAGVRGAVGLCGLDGALIKARRINADLGLVGEPTIVDGTLLNDLINLDLIPVVAPIGFEEASKGSFNPLNINADTAAGAVAQALSARSFLMMTDIAGVLNKDKVLMKEIESSAFESLKADGTISGGMIPKLETATQTVDAGVGEVSIFDGRERHALLKALSGENFGTRIIP